MSCTPATVIVASVIIGLIASGVTGGLVGLGVGVVLSGLVGLASYKSGSLIPMSLAVGAASEYIDKYYSEAHQLKQYFQNDAGVRQFLVRILNEVATAASVRSGSRRVEVILRPRVFLASRNDALALISNQYPGVNPMVLSMTVMKVAEFAVCTDDWPGRIENEMVAHALTRELAEEDGGSVGEDDLPF